MGIGRTGDGVGVGKVGGGRVGVGAKVGRVGTGVGERRGLAKGGKDIIGEGEGNVGCMGGRGEVWKGEMVERCGRVEEGGRAAWIGGKVGGTAERAD